MAKKQNIKAEKTENFAKGKCSECDRTDQLRPVLHYNSKGRGRMIRKCPDHFQHA